MKDPCTVTVQMEKTLRTKARYLATRETRNLSAYIRQLIKREVRAFEETDGPIPENKEGGG